MTLSTFKVMKRDGTEIMKLVYRITDAVDPTTGESIGRTMISKVDPSKVYVWTACEYPPNSYVAMSNELLDYLISEGAVKESNGQWKQ